MHTDVAQSLLDSVKIVESHTSTTVNVQNDAAVIIALRTTDSLYSDQSKANRRFMLLHVMTTTRMDDVAFVVACSRAYNYGHTNAVCTQAIIYNFCTILEVHTCKYLTLQTFHLIKLWCEERRDDLLVEYKYFETEANATMTNHIQSLPIDYLYELSNTANKCSLTVAGIHYTLDYFTRLRS